jgi:prephenate dehydrogenase
VTLEGSVLVVGTGLLGTSIGLALRAAGVEVYLKDANPEHVRTATSLGAGVPATPGIKPELVVIAVPPRFLAEQIVEALHSTSATVTDVGSVKTLPLQRVRAEVAESELARYVGSHPMAGSERSGPLAASSLLFEGRPWAVTPHETSAATSVALVERLVAICQATAYTFTPEEHDQAVARTSHLPHVFAALVAGRLPEAPQGHLVLSGQGVRDVTRIAAGDPALWQQILVANAPAVTALLAEVRADLKRFEAALNAGDLDELGTLLGQGVAGTAVIPGKHGGVATREVGLFVAVPDHPGELARLLADVGEIGVNIEDLRIDHDPGRAVGLVELRIAHDAVDGLQRDLEARGWSTHG